MNEPLNLRNFVFKKAWSHSTKFYLLRSDLQKVFDAGDTDNIDFTFLTSFEMFVNSGKKKQENDILYPKQ